jgi:hypothetical protein
MIHQWAWEEAKCTFETILTSFVPNSVKWKVKMHDFVRKLEKVHMPAHIAILKSSVGMRPKLKTVCLEPTRSRQRHRD